MKRISLLIVLGLIIIGLGGCMSNEINETLTTKASENSQNYPMANSSKLIVLNYHNITKDNLEVSGSSLAATDFRKQMSYLYDNNYNILGIEDFLAYYNQKSFPEKSVMITFDDGYESFFTIAYPVLKKYDFKAIIFPIVSMTPGLEREILWNKHLTFHQIRLMDKESGLIDIGSHTYDLHYYQKSGQPAIKAKDSEEEKEYISRIKKDLRVSKDILELQTDKKILAIAWPYGLTNKTSVDIAKELGYKLFFTLQQKPVTSDTPLDNIPRYAVISGSIEEFKEIVSQ